MKKTGDLLEFPCNFPVKIIGLNTSGYIKQIEKIIKKHFADFDISTIETNFSKESKYLSCRITVYALNQKMLDEFYQEVSRHPEVKMVL